MVLPSNKIIDLFGDCVDDIQDSQDELSSSLLGRYAEFMVCAQITKSGYRVTHVDGVGFDLILTVEEGSFTIQVKSTSVIVDGKCRWNLTKHIEAGNGGRNKERKPGRLSIRDADMLALFHHSFGTTVIMPMRLHMPTYIALPVSQIQQANIDDSLQSSLLYLFEKLEKNKK